MNPYATLEALLGPVRNELNTVRDLRTTAEQHAAILRNREEALRERYNALYSAMVAFEERNRG